MGVSLSGSILTKKTLNFSLFFLSKLFITKFKLFNVIGQTSGQLVNPKKIAVRGPSNDFSVIILSLTSLSENEDPFKDATYSSFLFSIDKKIGSIINRKINEQQDIIVIDVFNFIVDIINLPTI